MQVYWWTFGKHVKQSLPGDELCAELLLDESSVRRMLILRTFVGVC
jgi:hypothetical protein